MMGTLNRRLCGHLAAHRAQNLYFVFRYWPELTVRNTTQTQAPCLMSYIEILLFSRTGRNRGAADRTSQFWRAEVPTSSAFGMDPRALAGSQRSAGGEKSATAVRGSRQNLKFRAFPALSE
jgi:hypothetical protein